MNSDRILVTGAGGFVGRHFMKAVQAAFPLAQIIGTGLNSGHGTGMDITNSLEVRARIAKFNPDVCVHLAGISSIGSASADPAQAWNVNLQGTLNLANAIMAEAPQCRMIFISSGECYGESFKPGKALDETAPLAPMNLYAATKAAAEMALGAMACDGLRLHRLRPFNHTGPEQSDAFVTIAFAKQIARIEAGLAPPEIAVGSLDPERDFLDVRDVCAAYICCIEQFDGIANNQTFNVSSGHGVKIGTLLNMLLAKAKCPISIRQDSTRIRRVEIKRAVGNPGLAQEMLGWRPQFSLDETLDTIMDYVRPSVLS